MIISILENYGLIGIFVIAVMEAIFLPVPVETLLIPYVIVNPKMIIFAIIVSTMGSVIGASIGYILGRYGEKLILSKFIKDKSFSIAKKYFTRYGVWAVGIAAITPLPYKIFAMISGVMGLKIQKLIKVSFLFRGMRFITVAATTLKFGDRILSIFT